VDAGAFAAGKTTDGEVELFDFEEEAGRPTGDVLGAIAEDDGIAGIGKGAAEGHLHIELVAVLIEVGDLNTVSAAYFAGVGL